MKTYFRNLWNVTPVFLTAVLIAGGVYAQSTQGMQGDVTGEMKLKAGAEKMIQAEHMITASLQKQGLMENPAIAKGNAMLMDGEKMVLEGKELMQQSETRILGKEIMMKGSTKMMEGKDVIMKELKEKGLMKTTALKEDEHGLMNGENMMLEGKDLMMDGERNFK
jgi:hypothetical protein